MGSEVYVSRLSSCFFFSVRESRDDDDLKRLGNGNSSDEGFVSGTGDGVVSTPRFVEWNTSVSLGPTSRNRRGLGDERGARRPQKESLEGLSSSNRFSGVSGP